MIRRLFDSIRTRLAVHQHQNPKPKPLQLTYSEAYAIQAFRGLGAQTNFPDRLGQAAQLEAQQVSAPLVEVLCSIAGRGQLNADHLHRLSREGIAIHIGDKPIEDRIFDAFRDTAYDVATTNKMRRLQQAVKQLAFIAGPGFTTQHLIDEGMLHEGDI